MVDGRKGGGIDNSDTDTGHRGRKAFMTLLSRRDQVGLKVPNRRKQVKTYSYVTKLYKTDSNVSDSDFTAY